ncbi:MAG: hypothetical protein M3P98_04525 [bacterium]|nr:hypothetical protein [bacterium]
MNKESLISGYLNRLRGWGDFVRQDYLLIRQLELSDSEWMLYRTIKDLIMDWDKRHLKHGGFVFDIDQLQFYTGWNRLKVERAFRSLIKRNLVVRVKKDIQLYEVVGMDVALEYMKGKKGSVFGEAVLQKKHFYFFREFLKRIIGNETANTIFSEVNDTNSVNLPIDYLTIKPFQFLIYSGDIVSFSGEYSLESGSRMVHDEYVNPDEIPF